MAASADQAEKDGDGILIQKYDKRVLFVVPSKGFGDQTLRYARSSLAAVAVGSAVLTNAADRRAQGRLQDDFEADGDLAGASVADFAGIVIAAGDCEPSLARDERVAKLLREARADGKLIASWGNGLEALIGAGVVKGHRVTGTSGLRAAARRAGASFSGRQLEVSGALVTAKDEGAGMRFGQALAQGLRS